MEGVRAIIWHDFKGILGLPEEVSREVAKPCAGGSYGRGDSVGGKRHRPVCFWFAAVYSRTLKGVVKIYTRLAEHRFTHDRLVPAGRNPPDAGMQRHHHVHLDDICSDRIGSYAIVTLAA